MSRLGLYIMYVCKLKIKSFALKIEIILKNLKRVILLVLKENIKYFQHNIVIFV